MKPTLPSVLFFDVNETLLDLQPLEKAVDETLLESGISKLWFETLLHYSLVLTVNEQYQSMGEIGAATLRMMAHSRNIKLSEEQAKAVLKPMKTLPPHAEVAKALEKLKAAGFRLATLTNSDTATAKQQLDAAGLTHFFERQFSVETLGKFKPHQEVYHWACSQMGIGQEQAMLVAAHAWDIAGAAWAGMQTAFIQRANKQPFALALSPDFSARDLHDLCEQLINKELS